MIGAKKSEPKPELKPVEQLVQFPPADHQKREVAAEPADLRPGSAPPSAAKLKLQQHNELVI